MPTVQALASFFARYLFFIVTSNNWEFEVMTIVVVKLIRNEFESECVCGNDYYERSS